MYIIILKKTEMDKRPFPIEKILIQYFNKRNNDIILVSPGYMSYTKKTIKNFCVEFCNLNTTSTNEFIFAKGMNGRNKVKNLSIDIVDEYYNNICQKNNQVRHSLFLTKNDHSKFLIFIDKKSACIYDNKELNVKELLSDFKTKVNAILLGSSNFSYNTYFNSPTDKGEADIFMISENVFDNDDEIVGIINGLRKENELDGELILSKEMGINQNLNILAQKLLKE